MNKRIATPQATARDAKSREEAAAGRNRIGMPVGAATFDTTAEWIFLAASRNQPAQMEVEAIGLGLLAGLAVAGLIALIVWLRS